MSVILRNCCPPLVEVGNLGGLCLQVYSFLWVSAYKDARYDKHLHLSREQRRHCGGTTEWSVKGIAVVLGSSRNKVSDALDKLLDNGFIIAEAFIANGRGTKHTLFRVVHPNQIENVRHAYEIIGIPASIRRKNLITRPINPHIDEAGKQVIKSKVSKEERDFFQSLEDDYVENFSLFLTKVGSSQTES